MSNNNKIINGKELSKIFLQDLHNKIIELRLNSNIVPKLCIIQIGSNESSNLYIQNKIQTLKLLNMDMIHLKFKNDITESCLIENIEKLNQDDEIHGIIVQLPLPAHISVNNISKSIDPTKDVDGFHPVNLGYLLRGENKGFTPCTPLGCIYLLKHYLGTIESQHIVIIGRSNIVGRPLASLLINNNATVTLCHSYTKNLKDITKSANIVVSAIGSPKLLDQSYFQDNVVVIDVGITKIAGKFVGDVDFNDVVEKASFITPVPGGVGPMTVAYLMHNLYKAALNQSSH